MKPTVPEADVDGNRQGDKADAPVLVLRDVHKSFGEQRVLNGISLTVAGVDDRRFDVQIIPFTWEHTNLRGLKANDAVNLECDMLGKYVLRALEAARPK